MARKYKRIETCMYEYTRSGLILQRLTTLNASLV
jgi:hypothetical protein